MIAFLNHQQLGLMKEASSAIDINKELQCELKCVSLLRLNPSNKSFPLNICTQASEHPSAETGAPTHLFMAFNLRQTLKNCLACLFFLPSSCIGRCPSSSGEPIVAALEPMVTTLPIL